jgi:hypothetical protein
MAPPQIYDETHGVFAELLDPETVLEAIIREHDTDEANVGQIDEHAYQRTIRSVQADEGAEIAME